MGKITGNISKTLVLNFQSYKATIFFCSILIQTYFIYFQVEIIWDLSLSSTGLNHCSPSDLILT